MPALTIRQVSAETHRALKVRAARNGRSTEAEVRAILEEAVQPKVRLGSALREVGQRFGGVELKLRRDKTPVTLADLG